LNNLLIHGLVLHVLSTICLRLGLPPPFNFGSEGATFLRKNLTITVRFFYKVHLVDQIPPGKTFSLICVKRVIQMDALVTGVGFARKNREVKKVHNRLGGGTLDMCQNVQGI
jgi:hypothetical protein